MIDGKNRLDNYLAKNLKLIKDPILFPEGIGSYILEGHEPVSEPDILKWAKWLQVANRRVSKDIVIKHGEGAITVSTVFLGLDYQFNPNGSPLLFETMIFGGEFDLDIKLLRAIDALISISIMRATSGLENI